VGLACLLSPTRHEGGGRERDSPEEGQHFPINICGIDYKKSYAGLAPQKAVKFFRVMNIRELSIWAGAAGPSIPGPDVLSPVGYTHHKCAEQGHLLLPSSFPRRRRHLPPPTGDLPRRSPW
jgi:hypothetical protein